MSMSHIQQTIERLEQELDAIDQRRGDIAKAIETLRPIAGDDTPTRVQPGQKHRGSPVTAGPVRRTKKSGAKGEAILEALRRRSPQTPGMIAKATGMTVAALRLQIKSLEQQGLVVTSGTTNDRQISLPTQSRKSATKEEP